jgi:hypothetical protein
MCVGCYGKDEREYGRNKTRTTENEEGVRSNSSRLFCWDTVQMTSENNEKEWREIMVRGEDIMMNKWLMMMMLQYTYIYYPFPL